MKIARTLGILFLAAHIAPSAQAQGYPARPIQVIVPLAAGSAGDAMLRVVAQQMSENMKQQLVLENQPGAAGLIGAARVARAPADGYTIGGFSDSVLNYAPSLSANVSFDPVNDFAPISFIASVGWVLVAHPSTPANNVRELIALVKSQPGKIDYASAGSGSPHHIVMELFKRATGTNLSHIPYKGATQATIDVVGGQVPLMFSALSVAQPFIRDGKLRALAVLGAQRSSLLPDVPTLAETLPGFTFDTWLGLYAPKGTPQPLIDKLNGEVGKALAMPKIKERLLGMGFEAQSSTPEQLLARTRDGLARVSRVIRDAGIKPE